MISGLPPGDSSTAAAERRPPPPLLTFDDGPAADTDPLLDILAACHVEATFFLVGERAVARPELVARILREGHVVGNHSWDHPDLRTLPLGEVREQLERTNDAIERAGGVRPELFRAPYGFSSPAIDEIAAELGMRRVHWDVEVGDWLKPGVEAIANAIVTAAPGAIVLLHDGGGDRSETVAGVARALAAFA